MNWPAEMPLQEFPEKQELHRNMLGLLGNVAEVRQLRPQLMTSQFIGVFRLVPLTACARIGFRAFPVLPQLPGYAEPLSLPGSSAARCLGTSSVLF